MDWNKINTSEDIDNFLNLFGGFHDSCLKELYMWTDSYVDDDLSMGMSSGTNVRILFQRQYEQFSAVELLFEGVTQFHITPNPENYDSIIFDASFTNHKGLYYWADDIDWKPGDYERENVSWISAKNVKWRDASSWMGKIMRYGVLKQD